ncbi:LOW QUALITY PROTEIN: Integrase catalytic core protein [Phytophthora palmivora]|uniref:Integrase catalytic core protein n=1 Tax=Phytophthora palmivora TaxID=4796 RepID=A0A2P4YHN4_9STRA|nr:LOW QUALITY PROTEIN: Integrase catalytic core protein [Phytophthora palmivora]
MYLDPLLLYGLKQGGRLWSKLLHQKLTEVGFNQSLVDMCVYFRRKDGVLLVVGVYVDDLLVAGTKQEAVDAFFAELASLSVKKLGCAHKFLGIRVTYDKDAGYDLAQEVTIMDMLREHGMELAHGVRAPIGHEWNENQDEIMARLPAFGSEGAITVTKFRSLVGSLLWVARCTRPDIAFAVHKVTRRAHCPTMADWKLTKRILRYLAGTKNVRLRMHGKRKMSEPLNVVGYSDADFAADKEDLRNRGAGHRGWNARELGVQKPRGVSLSTMEAEYTAASVVGQELLGIHELLGEMGIGCGDPMYLRVDNQAALKQLDGEKVSSKAKHIDVRIKFVVDYAKRGVLKTEYCESERMLTDMFTKVLADPRLKKLAAVVGLH